jgi:glutaconate CoA-transferase, subunit B
VEHTSDELMTVVASRALQDGEVCFVGIGAPSAACNLARLTHAPNLVLIYESGTIQTRPDALPLPIGDGELCETALTTVPVVEMFQYWLQGGRISKGFLGGAQIDRYANINTTVIGPYDAPDVRLPGGGRRTRDRRVLPRGPHHRQALAAGLRTAGPVLAVTDLCTLEPDPDTAELTVTSLHQGVTQQQVEEATCWPVRFATPSSTTEPPTREELEVLRELHARTARAHARA